MIYYKLTTNEEGVIIQVESSSTLEEGYIELTKDQIKLLEKPNIKLDEVITNDN